MHQSAKNFFRKKMEDKAQRHSRMTLYYLRALSEQLGKSAGVKEREVEEPRHYATWYWLKHLSQLNDEAVLEKYDVTMGKVAEFFEKHFLQWLETLTPTSVLAQALTQLVGLESILRVCLLFFLFPFLSSTAFLSELTPLFASEMVQQVQRRLQEMLLSGPVQQLVPPVPSIYPESAPNLA